ncbi:MAG TPA: hypothetical protein VG389_01415 [Myxococcota bacterium]|jgi:hypothetical protein|nr:hypothetical protein [Myxococcota bacterium]
MTTTRAATLAWPAVAVATAAALAVAASGAACTNAALYRPGYEPDAPNKLTLSGRICTEDFQRRRFPVKVAFVMDSSPEILQNDPTNSRGAQLMQIVSRFANDNYSYAFIQWAADTFDPTLLGTYTRDPALIDQALLAMAGNLPCGNGCRDYASAVSRTDSLVSGDILSTPLGLVARSKYVVVFLANGPPTPAVPVDDRGTPDPADDCDQTCVLKERVAAIRDFALANGAVEMTFHGIYVDNCALSPAQNDAAAALVQEMAFAGAGAFFRVGIPHECYDTDAAGAPIDNDGDGAANAFDPDCAGTTCGFWESPSAMTPVTPVSFASLDFDPARSPFIKKSLIVSNVNVLPAADGVRIDSDADGLGDDEETAMGLDPVARDTDGDGLSDLVELYYTALGLSPSLKEALPPVGCAGDPPFTDADGDGLDDDKELDLGTDMDVPDTDGDGLWDCEERVAGTNPTLFDSDADGVPDGLELRGGTIAVSVDQNLDADVDGVTNGDEIAHHSDAVAYDRNNQLTFDYRYTEIDEGLQTLPYIEQPVAVSGVTVETMSPGTALGAGTLSWDAAAMTLTWTQSGDTPGAPVTIGGDGLFTLHSGSSCVLRGTCGCDLDNPDPAECECGAVPCDPGNPFATCGSDAVCDTSTLRCCEPGTDRSLTVRVTTYALPMESLDEFLNVGETERDCISFRVRNITLVETGLDPLVGVGGMNSVFVFFGQVPVERPMSYPLFRVALVRVRYLEATSDAPALRDPESSEIPLTDDDFVVYEY